MHLLSFVADDLDRPSCSGHEARLVGANNKILHHVLEGYAASISARRVQAPQLGIKSVDALIKEIFKSGESKMKGVDPRDELLK